MNNDKKASLRANLILDILVYAEKNNLDVHEREDVKKILTALHIPYFEDDFDEWISDIQDADTFMDIADKEREQKRKKLVN